jgi:TonB family protein
MEADRPVSAPSVHGTRAPAAASTALHLGLLFLLLRMVAPQPPVLPDPIAVQVLFGPAAPGRAAIPEAAPASAQHVPAQPAVDSRTSQTTAAPMPTGAVRKEARHMRAAIVPPRRNDAAASGGGAAPASSASAASTGAPKPTSAAADDDAASLAHLGGSIHEAVQAAAVMPAAARRQRREGRAQVGFSYLDGAVAEIALIQSSQSRLLDDAAIDAVRSAHYPMPPAPLRGRKLPIQVWVEFRLSA